MSEAMLSLVKEYGVIGVYISQFIEGTALPFIGTFVVISYGFLLDLTWLEILAISIAGAIVYTVGSWVPYYFGFYLEGKFFSKLRQKNKDKLGEIKRMFSKHGIWSIALSSPLPLGNLVPLAAGISKISLWKYSILTLCGIAPSTFLFLLLGQIVPISANSLMAIINQYQLVLTFILITSFVLYYFIKRKKVTKPEGSTI